MADRDKPFMHTVHTKFHMHTPHESMRDIMDRFKQLRKEFTDDPGVAFLTVALNTRRSRHAKSRALKLVHMVQVVAFKNQESFRRFREHPLHTDIKERLRYHADWDSADVDLTDPQFNGFKAISAL